VLWFRGQACYKCLPFFCQLLRHARKRWATRLVGGRLAQLVFISQTRGSPANLNYLTHLSKWCVSLFFFFLRAILQWLPHFFLEDQIKIFFNIRRLRGPNIISNQFYHQNFRVNNDLYQQRDFFINNGYS